MKGIEIWTVGNPVGKPRWGIPSQAIAFQGFSRNNNHCNRESCTRIDSLYLYRI